MKRKVVAIVQARMASSRLPGKVLMDLEGDVMLGRVVVRTREASMVDDVIVATTTESADDAIVEFCRGRGILSARGSHFDVLDRYYSAALKHRAEVVVRITADCPLIDPGLIDKAVRILLGEIKADSSPAMEAGGAPDLVANRLPPPWKRTYPIGLDTEVCSFGALERTWHEATSAADREHVMPYMYSGLKLVTRAERISTGKSQHGFRVALLDHTEDLGSYRWTVDTAEDLEFVRKVYSYFSGHSDFSWLDVLELLKSHPELPGINAGIRHKTLQDIDDRAPGVDGS
jgi:spore coat polysaccharide biosynthesis protein SpsF